MKAGRERDALVAEKVMGWTDCVVELDPVEDVYGQKPDDNPHPITIPCYSTDIAAAQEAKAEILRKGRYIGFEVYVTFDGVAAKVYPHPCEDLERIHLTVDPRDIGDDVEPWDPRVESLAICLAALKAVGWEPTDD